MVIALAGRRIDDSNAEQPRFPAENADAVKHQIREILRSHSVEVLVCAAACGADIIALEAAGELGIRRRVVLPFDKATFRTSSVVDRGYIWGERYDRIIAEVEAQSDLVELMHIGDNKRIYFTGNCDILDQAQCLAHHLKTGADALLVWDGKSYGAEDVTAHFGETATARGMRVTAVKTL
jgi:hypothetical protein